YPCYLHSFPTRRSSDLVQSHWTLCFLLFLHALRAGGSGLLPRLLRDCRLRIETFGRDYILLCSRHGDPDRLASQAIAHGVLLSRSEEHTSELQSRGHLV